MRGLSIFDRWNESLVGFEEWCPSAYRTHYARQAFRRARTAARLRRLASRFRRAVFGNDTLQRVPAWWLDCSTARVSREETVPLRAIRGTRAADGSFEVPLPPLHSNAEESWVRLYKADPDALPAPTLYEEDAQFYVEAEAAALITVGILRLRGIERVRARVARRVPRCDSTDENEKRRSEPTPQRCARAEVDALAVGR